MNTFAFGNFVLQTDPGRLLHDGADLELGGRALTLLQVLVEHHDQTLAKDRLMQLAWPDATVSDNSLHVYINKLRNTIGRDWIVTVDGAGYRFAGKVRRLGRGAQRDVLAAAPAANLLGREADAAALLRALQTQSLVSVVGPGGVGKSALVRAVAGDAQSHYDDGVLWVDLTDWVDAMQVSNAVASAAGLSFSAGGGMGLLSELAARHALLVLDNAEHVATEVAELCQRLHLKPGGLTVLVTSQAPLMIAGESVLRLAGLATPPEAAGPQAATASPAVQLFCERARQARADFVLTPDNAASIGQIVRVCDGLPMAIELVAAQVDVLDADAQPIEAGLLAAGRFARRDVPERQRSLRAALDWSLQRLTPEDQELLMSLAVFDGGFSVEAAATLLQRAREDVAERLAELVRRSLVQSRGDPARFHLLHLVRRQLAERLEAAGRWHAMRLRHADWCLGLGRNIGERLRADSGANLDFALEEAANMRAAHKWAIGPGQSAAHAMSFAGDLFPYWDCTARYAQAQRCCAASLTLPGADADALKPLRLRAVRTVAFSALHQGDHVLAAAMFADMQRLAAELGDAPRGAWAAQGIAVCALLAGRAGDAVPQLRATMAQMQAQGEHTGAVFCAVYLVLALVDLERLDEARAAAEEGLDLARHGSSLPGAAYAHGALGYAAWTQRDFDCARAHMEAALQLATRLNMVRGQARAESGLARILLDQGDVAGSVGHFQRALAILVECDLNELLTDTLIGAAQALMHRHQLAPAVRVLSAAERLAEHAGRLAPHDRRALATMLEDARSQLARGTCELATTEGKMMTPRVAALYALDALKSGAVHAEAELQATPLRRVV